MLFLLHTPAFPLGHFIESFIYFEGVQHAHNVDRFLPNGDVELLIDLNDAPQFIYDNDTLAEKQACRHVWASGVRTEPITIPAGNGSKMIVVAFRKGMAYPFFPFPMGEIADTVVDGDLIWGREILLLRERLLETADINERFAAVEEFLLGKYADRLVTNPCVAFAVAEMRRNPAEANIRHMTGQIGYSQKHFIDIFKRHVGITPKAYLKVMRFQRAVADIESGSETDWARVAHDCGFYDQSHFINDFKLFSGFTPETYLERKNGILNYVPVG